MKTIAAGNRLDCCSRRQFLRASAMTASAVILGSPEDVAADRDATEDERQVKTYRSKASGCFLGAAIADAMGGPVECQHYKRIAREFTDFEGFLPYRKPPGLIGLGPGYALDGAPGNITDDSYIRQDLARFLIENNPPYTAGRFAPWLLKHADFTNWWKVAVQPLRRIESGAATAETAGLNHKQGGGWWQPVAMLYAGDAKAASAVAPMPPHVAPRTYAEGFYSGILFAEQQPLALAYFVYGEGDPKKTVLTAVKGGRDADSIATNSASWLGALAGESVWPQQWLQTVQRANLRRVNLKRTAEALVDRALKNGTVRLAQIGN